MTSPAWTFMSNHGHVLAYLAVHPEALLREAAEEIGLTQRSVTGIVRDLVEGGYLVRKRIGRRNTYSVVPGTRFRHPVESNVRVEDFLALLTASSPSTSSSAQRSAPGS